MKHFYLIVALTLSLRILAQPYSNFVVEGTHWEVQSGGCPNGCNGVFAYPHFTRTSWYKLEGDTLIDSLTYKKMYWSYFNEYWHTITDYYATHQTWILLSVVREDTAERKVYIRPASYIGLSDFCVNAVYAADSLWFDFSKTIGDTLKLQSHSSGVGAPCINDPYLIDDSKSTYTNNAYAGTKQAVRLSPLNSSNHSNPFWLIEGVGPSFGLFGAPEASFEGDFGSQLIRYCVGPDSICGRGYVYSDISHTEQETGLALYPNPFTSQLVITNSNQLHILFTLYDLTGRQVANQVIEAGTTTLNTSNIESGVYLAVFVSADGSKTSKRVIKD